MSERDTQGGEDWRGFRSAEEVRQARREAGLGNPELDGALRELLDIYDYRLIVKRLLSVSQDHPTEVGRRRAIVAKQQEEAKQREKAQKQKDEAMRALGKRPKPL